MRYLNRLAVLALFLVLLMPLAYSQLYLNEIMANEPGSDTNLEWIELFNNGFDVNLTGWTLSDLTSNQSLSGILSSDSYLVLYGSELNITLNNAGDTITLSNENQSTTYSVTYPSLNENESYGLYPDASANEIIFLQTTAGKANHLSAQIKLNTIDNIAFNQTNISLNYSVIDDYLYSVNCTFYLNDTMQSSDLFSENSSIEKTFLLSDGIYTWNISCADDELVSFSETRAFNVNVSPEINLTYTVHPSSIDFRLFFTEVVEFNLSSTMVNFTISNNSRQNYYAFVTGLNQLTNYNLTINFCDLIGNCNSIFENVTTTQTPPVKSCDDGIQNQDETGIDCGGLCDACTPFYRGSGGSAPVLTTNKYEFNFTGSEKYAFEITSLDRIKIFFNNEYYILLFSNVSLGGANMRFYPSRYNITLNTHKPVLSNLSNTTTALEFEITKIYENEERFRKFQLRDFVINLTMRGVDISQKEPESIPVVENKTVIIEEKARLGVISVSAKSTIKRPASTVVGISISASIILLGLAIFFVIRKAALA